MRTTTNNPNPRGDLIGEFAERRDAAILAALGDRINAAAGEPTSRERLLAGIGETYLGETAESHFVRVARHHVAQNPFLRPGRRDGQLKPAAVAVLSRLRGLHFARCQLGLAHEFHPQNSP